MGRTIGRTGGPPRPSPHRRTPGGLKRRRRSTTGRVPYTRLMRPTDLRRLVILAEGEFAPHSAKTAYGVIRYGRDDVVAVIDSTRAGENVSRYLPGHDIPIVASLAEALALPARPDVLLIG